MMQSLIYTVFPFKSLDFGQKKSLLRQFSVNSPWKSATKEKRQNLNDFSINVLDI